MGLNHLDGFHFSRVFLPLASSKFFGFGLQYVSRFRKRYLHYSLSEPGQQVFIRWSDFVGFSRINGLRLFGSWSTKGFSRLFGLHYGFSGLWINSISQELGFGVLRILGFGFFEGFWILLFSDFWILGFFRDLGCFRLLIQRCKSVPEKGNFFDKGCVLPDESKNDPTNDFCGCKSSRGY